MGLLRRLGSLLSGRPGADTPANTIAFYVRCDQCGEVVRVRAHRNWDLVQEFGDGGTGYSLHKDVLGVRCNRLMRMHVRFGPDYRIKEQQVEGGRFATEGEYTSQASGPEA